MLTQPPASKARTTGRKAERVTGCQSCYTPLSSAMCQVATQAPLTQMSQNRQGCRSGGEGIRQTAPEGDFARRFTATGSLFACSQGTPCLGHDPRNLLEDKFNPIVTTSPKATQSKRHAQDNWMSMGFKVMIISPSKSLR